MRAENKLQSISLIVIPQVIRSHGSSSQTTTQIISTISEHKPRKSIKHVFETIYKFYSAGSQHGQLHQLCVTMSSVTCLILRAYTETGVSHS